MAIIKEYQEQTINMGSNDPVIAGVTSTLRFDDNRRLTMPDLAALFAEAAQDWRMGKLPEIVIKADRIEVGAAPRRAPNDYIKLPSKSIGAQG